MRPQLIIDLKDEPVLKAKRLLKKYKTLKDSLESLQDDLLENPRLGDNGL